MMEHRTYVSFGEKKRYCESKLLTVDEILDGLRFCKIKQEETRKISVQSRDELMI